MEIYLAVMKLRTSSVLLHGGLLASGFVRAASTPSKALLVLAKSDNTLAIVDHATFCRRLLQGESSANPLWFAILSAVALPKPGHPAVCPPRCDRSLPGTSNR